MLYFSNREMKILRLMAQKRKGISMNELIQALNVSKRTVYRELSNLEETLQPTGVTLKTKGKLYQLEGEDEAIEELFNQLKDPVTIEWGDVEKRQVAILAMIALKSEKAYTQTQLTHIFDVSLTTIQQDIAQLNKRISNYKLWIERSEDASLTLSGSEVYIRLYLSQVVSGEINEFDFFNAIEHTGEQTIETESQYILSLIDTEILKMVYSAFKREQAEIVNKMTDDILMNFVLMFTISLMRLENEKRINTTYSIDSDQLFPYVQKILTIVKTFKKAYKTKINTIELSFFAMQLRGLNVQKSHSIFKNPYDMELAVDIKYLIKRVSAEFQFNFNADQVLYHDLINHIGAALKRIDLQLPEMESEVIAKLRTQYPKLYATVEGKLVEVFMPAIFSEQEIGYIVTHFASSFEKYGYQSDLRILVVCTSGIGTSKILKNRLERSISEIEQIDVVRAVDLNDVDTEGYDVIFSTITLPGFDADYTLINPILDDQDIEVIKQRLKLHPKKKEHVPKKIEAEQIKTVPFSKVKQFVSLADSLIHDFDVLYLEQNFHSLDDYIEEIFQENKRLIEKIKQRLEMSPLAIPNTGILLLHTTERSIDRPMSSLHHLKHPVRTMGMDQQPTMVHRLFIMFGPEEMDDLTTEYLGEISSSIIENESDTKVYQNGTTEDIKRLLENLSVDVLQKLLGQ